MKNIEFLKPGLHLADLKLKVGELVKVWGVTYRYTIEKDGTEHVLTPAQ